MDPRQSRRSRDLDDSHASDNPNVFSDDYAESIAESYADSQDALSIRRPDSVRSLTPPLDRRQSPSRPSDHQSQTLPSTFHRPSGSISKHGPATRTDSPGPAADDPFADSAALPPINTSPLNRDSVRSAMAHRSLSSSSFAGSQSPASPHEGPSHPYAMYPQALSMSRTPSVATNSTRPLSLLSASRGPSHPYDSYSQTVQQDGVPVQNGIQVGFPGANNTYLRRVGPEGEEQDIIGADGHAEQLPPYSRYPEEVHLKSVNALPPINESSSPVQSTAQHSTSQVALTERSSRTNLPLVVNGRPMTQGSSSDGTGLSEKSWSEKSWRERRKTRICGVACGLWMLAFITLGIIILISTTVIGVTLGVEKSKHHHKEETETSSISSIPSTSTPSVSVTQTHTSFVDAAPVATTPAGLAPLATGVYNLDTSEPFFQAQSCLPYQEQPAWSCLLPQNKVLLNVTTSDPVPMLQMTSIDHSFWYGVQPPTIQPQPMQLVRDMQTLGTPFAWHFQMNYKKLVILHAGDIDFNSSLHTRDMKSDLMANGFGMSEKSLDTVDQPWFCEWPGTVLDVMIYVGNGSTVSNSTASTGLSTGSSMPPTSTPPPTSTQYASSKQARHDYIGSSATTPIPTYADFPQIARIVEKRPSGTQPGSGYPPTCTQMNNVGTNGSIDYKPLLYNGNQLKVFKLDELSPPPTTAQQTANIHQRAPASAALDERDNYSASQHLCECVWNSPWNVNPSAVFGYSQSSPVVTSAPSTLSSASQPAPASSSYASAAPSRRWWT